MRLLDGVNSEKKLAFSILIWYHRWACMTLEKDDSGRRRRQVGNRGSYLGTYLTGL